MADYTNQLKALELAAKQKPDDPALRFLLGYQFAYLKYPKDAVRELGNAVKLEGRDPAARRLHDLFAVQVGAPNVGPVPQSNTPETSNPQPVSPTGGPPTENTGKPKDTGG